MSSIVEVLDLSGMVVWKPEAVCTRLNVVCRAGLSDVAQRALRADGCPGGYGTICLHYPVWAGMGPTGMGAVLAAVARAGYEWVPVVSPLDRCVCVRIGERDRKALWRRLREEGAEAWWRVDPRYCCAERVLDIMQWWREGRALRRAWVILRQVLRTRRVARELMAKSCAPSRVEQIGEGW